MAGSISMPNRRARLFDEGGPLLASPGPGSRPQLWAIARHVPQWRATRLPLVPDSATKRLGPLSLGRSSESRASLAVQSPWLAVVLLHYLAAACWKFAVELFLIGNAFLLLGALVCLDAHSSLGIPSAQLKPARSWLPLRPIFDPACDSLHFRLPLVWKMTDSAIQNFG